MLFFMIIVLFCDVGEFFISPMLEVLFTTHFGKERSFLLEFSDRTQGDFWVTAPTSSLSVWSEGVDLGETLCFYQQSH